MLSIRDKDGASFNAHLEGFGGPCCGDRVLGEIDVTFTEPTGDED